jgi:large subunit ribosomal protein L6
MSRIGKKPVPVPNGVTVTVNGSAITVKGPKGELSRNLHKEMQIKVENGTVVVERPSDEDRHRALHGLTRSLIANMVEGVTAGYKKQLEFTGVGYKAEV